MTTTVTVRGATIITVEFEVPSAFGGIVSAPGVKAGDILLTTNDLSDTYKGQSVGWVEGIISVDDQIVSILGPGTTGIIAQIILLRMA